MMTKHKKFIIINSVKKISLNYTKIIKNNYMSKYFL